MNLRWSFTTSFSAALAILATVIWSVGCTEPITGGGSSNLGSTGACAGEGGLFPSPVGPQSRPSPRPWEKFAVSKHMFQQIAPKSETQAELPAQTDLLVVINEKCVGKSSAPRGYFSTELFEPVRRRPNKLSQRAYSVRTRVAYTAGDLKKLVYQDSCVLHLSEDNMVTRGATVNDPQFRSQLHLTAIQAPDAWDTFHDGLTGEVVIAIIDDGMEMAHSDLSGVLWENSEEIAGNSIDDDGNGYVDDINGYNFSTDIGSPEHENGSTHGTHVAGLAAAEGNNSVGITGVMGRNVKIMVLNVFGSNAGASSAAIVNAIDYAAAMGADVINMSLGGQGTAPAVNTAMQNAVAAGAFIAVAAGNSNELVSVANFYQPMGYAKDIEGAMAIGSTDATTGLRSSFSNYSTTFVELGAPGSNAATGGVLSTFPPDTYDHLQGTSMASPVLAGAAALLVGWAKAQGGSITPAQVESLLKSSADSNGALTAYFLGGAALNMKSLAAAAICNYQ